MSIKVLQIAVALPYPPTDGGRQGIFYVTRSMSRAGAEVSMVTTDKPTSTIDPGELAGLCRRFVLLHKDTRNVLWRAAMSSLLSHVPYNVGKFADKRVLAEAVRLMREDPCDVVQLEGVYAAWYGFRLRRLFPSALYVLRAHNVEQQIFARAASSTSSLPLRLYLSLQAVKMRRFEDRAVLWADMVVPVTSVDCSELERRTGRRGGWHVATAGVDASVMKPVEVDNSAADIAFAGPLRWYPNRQGVEWFVKRVWLLVHARSAQSRFKVMGEPSADRWSVPPAPGVDTLGFVPSVETELASCRVFVVPLLSGSGIRLKILNAAAWGIPVVSTSIGAEGLDFQDGSEILIRDDPAEFAEAVLRLLTDDELWHRVRAAALDRVQREYSWPAIVGDLLTEYESAIALRHDGTSAGRGS
jgi:glycosyltransferase involved in cell wall biosynthesis